MLIFLVFPSQICPHSLWLLGRTTPVFKRLFFNAFSVDSSSVLFRGASPFILEFGFLGAGTQRFYLFFFLMGIIMTPKLIIIKNIFTFSNTLVMNNQPRPPTPPQYTSYSFGIYPFLLPRAYVDLPICPVSPLNSHSVSTVDCLCPPQIHFRS